LTLEGQPGGGIRPQATSSHKGQRRPRDSRATEADTPAYPAVLAYPRIAFSIQSIQHDITSCGAGRVRVRSHVGALLVTLDFFDSTRSR
jgi:hypothetical protein